MTDERDAFASISVRELAEFLEDFTHNLSPDEWIDWLAEAMPRIDNAKLIDGHRLPPPAEPLIAIPGTRRKIRLMMERYERGEQIFHPQDLAGDPVERGGRPIAHFRNGKDRKDFAFTALQDDPTGRCRVCRGRVPIGESLCEACDQVLTFHARRKVLAFPMPAEGGTHEVA